MNDTVGVDKLTDRVPSSIADLSDEELLLRYRQTRDRELFTELVGRYERELYNYLRRYLGDVEMAEDTFQATFLQVHLKCDQFDAKRRFRPWLYAVATNQAIDAQRRDRRQKMRSLEVLGISAEGMEELSMGDFLVSSEPSPSTLASDHERNELLQTAMTELTDQMRTAVQLVYYQGLKYREAAEIMAIPVGTVKSRLHAAIAKLTELWSRHEDKPE